MFRANCVEPIGVAAWRTPDHSAPASHRGFFFSVCKRHHPPLIAANHLHLDPSQRGHLNIPLAKQTVLV